MSIAPDSDAVSHHVVELHTRSAVDGTGDGQWSVSLVAGESRHEISGIDSRATPTRVALLAAIEGLSVLKRRCAVELYTDSRYLLQGATTWFPLRMSFGWLGGGDKRNRIRNHELWGQLRDLAARHDIHWHGPRRGKEGEFVGIMTEQKMELWRRTVGNGPDAGHVYSGHILPWDASLGEYRSFNDGEMGNPEGCSDRPIACSNVGNTDDNAVTPLTAKEKQARKRVIARIAAHYRPEYLRAKKDATSPVNRPPAPSIATRDSAGITTHSIALTPHAVDWLHKAFQAQRSLRAEISSTTLQPRPAALQPSA